MVGQRLFFPEEIACFILHDIKERAETYLGKIIKNAVLCIPTTFDESQRQALVDAGTIAGFHIFRTIFEPIAAAIAYGLDKKGSSQRKVLIFDLGAKTCNVTILNIKDGVFEIITTASDMNLGGEDFNNRLINHFILEYAEKNKKNISSNMTVLRRMNVVCEFVKAILSCRQLVNINVEKYFGEFSFTSTITRARFEELNDDLFRRTLVSVIKALHDAKLDKNEIDDIILVGGSCVIPKIRMLLQNFFDGKKLTTNIPPAEVVARGAAIQAALLNGEETVDGGKKYFHRTPLSLGIKTKGGVMTTLIKRGSGIAFKKTEYFTTSMNNQDEVLIQIYEGERVMTKDNNLLGQFKLTGITPVSRGIAMISVTFEVNRQGILKVSAEDKYKNGIHSKQEIIIDFNIFRMSEETIEKIIKEAEYNEDVDEKQRKRIDAMNSIEIFVLDMKTIIEEDKLKDKISKDDIKKVRSIINETQEWLNRKQLAEREELEEKLKELEEFFKPILTKINQSAVDDAPEQLDSKKLVEGNEFDKQLKGLQEFFKCPKSVSCQSCRNARSWNCTRGHTSGQACGDGICCPISKRPRLEHFLP